MVEILQNRFNKDYTIRKMGGHLYFISKFIPEKELDWTKRSEYYMFSDYVVNLETLHFIKARFPEEGFLILEKIRQPYSEAEKILYGK